MMHHFQIPCIGYISPQHYMAEIEHLSTVEENNRTGINLSQLGRDPYFFIRNHLFIEMFRYSLYFWKFIEENISKFVRFLEFGFRIIKLGQRTGSSQFVHVTIKSYAMQPCLTHGVIFY